MISLSKLAVTGLENRVNYRIVQFLSSSLFYKYSRIIFSVCVLVTYQQVFKFFEEHVTECDRTHGKLPASEACFPGLIGFILFTFFPSTSRPGDDDPVLMDIALDFPLHEIEALGPDLLPDL